MTDSPKTDTPNDAAARPPRASKESIGRLIAEIDRILAPAPEYLARLRREGLPYGRYRFTASCQRPWCMYATVSGLKVERKLGLADRWTPRQRDEAIAGLRDCQSPADRYFHCPICRGDLGQNFN